MFAILRNVVLNGSALEVDRLVKVVADEEEAENVICEAYATVGSEKNAELMTGLGVWFQKKWLAVGGEKE